jgi:serine/threonine protein kinase/tetratricopeptide (TPR) repeat protein
MRLGPYRVVEEIGRGGMGVVYRARSGDGREVALKLLLEADPQKVARFERERRILASFTEEDGFVPVLDGGSSPEGPYFVMPVLEGTLKARLGEGPLSVAEAAELGRALGSAIGRAHRRGIVHRDLKPGNVLFTAGGRPLVADLGLAKHFDRGVPGASDSLSLSVGGAFRGTIGYMPPEQMASAKDVGPPADVFALGAILYECLEGRPAFEADTFVGLIHKVTTGTLEPMRRDDVPPGLAQAIAKALQPDPAERFADGAALATALASDGRGRASRRLGAAGSRRAIRCDEAEPAAEPAAERGPGRLIMGGAIGLGSFLLVVALARSRESPRASLSEASPPAPSVPARPQAPTSPGQRVPAVPPPPPSAPDAAEEKERRALAARDELNRAELLEPAGSCDEEIAACSRAIELDPGLARAWVLRAAARGRKCDWRMGPGSGLDAAIADVSRAIELDPRAAAAWLVRGGARLGKGDVRGAIADWTRTIELEPASSVAWSNRGCAKRDMGDWDGVIEDCTRALELAPSLAEAWLARGTARERKGDRPGAVADYEHYIELVPASPEAGGLRTRFAELRGPRGSQAASGPKELTASELVARAHQEYAAGDIDSALADATKAIELDPKLPDAWLGRGGCWLLKKKNAEAAADFTKAIALDPGNWVAWYDRGVALDDDQAAIADYTRAIELDPKRPEPWMNRGTCRDNLKDAQGAIADYERALELEPDGTHAAKLRRWIEELRTKKSEPRQASSRPTTGAYFQVTVPDCDESERSSPVEVLLAGALDKLGTKNIEGALAQASRAVELAPKNQRAWLIRASCRLSKLDFNGALADDTRAIEIDAKQPHGWANRGAIKDYTGDAEGAIADYERALELDPKNQTIKDRLRELEATRPTKKTK